MSTVEQQLDDLEAQITSELPSDISVSSVKYEGPELVVYTRDPKKFAQQGDLIRQLASKLRKRITVRPDPSVLSRPEQAREEIMNVVPEDAGVTDLDFHADTGEVVIEAEKPGMVIGRHGSTLREITKTVGWTPEVVRTPPIESSTVSNVRSFLKQERDERRDILEKVGRQIHREEMSDDEYVRITTLGCCRESAAHRSSSRRPRRGSSSTAVTNPARRAKCPISTRPKRSALGHRPSTRSSSRTPTSTTPR